MDATTERTRAFIREYIRRVWDEQDLTALQELLDPDPAVQTQARAHLEELFNALSDFRVTVHDMIVEGQRVAVRGTISGRHTGAFAGVAPTGRRVSYDTIRIFDVRGDRVVGTWAIQDRLGLLQQLGALQDMPPVDWGGKIARER